MMAIAIDSLIDTVEKKNNNDDNKSILSALTGGTLTRYSSSPGVHNNRLELNDFELFGRAAEMEVLEEIFDRVVKGNSEMLLLKGDSGVGKSRLVKSFATRKALSSGTYFVEGKFDQLRRLAEPYSALQSAITDLCELLIQFQTPDELQETRQRLTKAFTASDITKLGALFTSFQQLTTTVNTARQQQQSEDESIQSHIVDDEDANISYYGSALTKFKFLCKKLIRTIASPEHPVILFLDDLQWADRGSLEVINSILQSTDESKHLLLICAYRINDTQNNNSTPITDDDITKPANTIDDTSSTTTRPDDADEGEQFLREFEKYTTPTTQSHIRCNTLEISNFDLNTIQLMLAKLFDCQEGGEDLILFSDLIRRKTHGNIYFVIQYLEHLQDLDLLVYCPQSQKWHFDVLQIQAKTNISENVVALVAARLGRLDQTTQHTLFYASCLGFTFNALVLERMMIGLQVVGEQETFFVEPSVASSKSSSQLDESQAALSGHSMIESMLNSAIQEGLIEQSIQHYFKFVSIYISLFCTHAERLCIHTTISSSHAINRHTTEFRQPPTRWSLRAPDRLNGSISVSVGYYNNTSRQKPGMKWESISCSSQWSSKTEVPIYSRRHNKNGIWPSATCILRICMRKNRGLKLVLSASLRHFH